jgi:hypothetical protein
MRDDLVTRLRTGKVACPSLEPTLSERPLSSKEWRQTGIEAADEIERLRAAIEQHTGLVAENALAWFGTQTNLELHHYSPVFCDDDDQSIEWRVTRVSGGYNDREWTTVGRGTTPLEAIQSARAAPAHPQGEDK